MRHILDLVEQLEVEEGNSEDGSMNSPWYESEVDKVDEDANGDDDSGSDSDRDYEDTDSGDEYAGAKEAGGSQKEDARSEAGIIDDDDDALGRSVYRPPEGTRPELAEALFQLSTMFWTYQCQDGVMAQSALVHFTAVIGVHQPSLAYRSAYYSTPDLAAFVWVGRLFFIEIPPAHFVSPNVAAVPSHRIYSSTLPNPRGKCFLISALGPAWKKAP